MRKDLNDEYKEDYEMKWMEMVRLRTLQSNEKWLPALLFDSIRSRAGEPGLLDIHVYRNASSQSDVSITFVWETESSDPQGSSAALSIAQTLNAYGLVEHSVWLEKDPKGAAWNG